MSRAAKINETTHDESLTANVDARHRVGTSLLFESERVRVWEMVLEPGASSGVHEHLHDYVYVYVTPDNELEVRVAGEPPAPSVTDDNFVSYTRVGDATDARLTHELVNVGDAPHRQILVELLDGHGAGPSRSQTNGRGRERWSEGTAQAGS